ncbi:peptide deformylase [Legionella brunensis]|uniref:Peptide deformylase n=1 Tax=Legionella brunensis TaxID=29422 RepID=A0A0W0SM72_9GAMM|nr:peptide deformylase [Legionella brunensis]KTC84506.1 polypeptide deformylase [Legionella brunensis]
MPSRPVLKMGNRQLVMPSEPLDNFAKLGRAYPGLNELLEDMLATMEEKGGVGIAAPQIGCNKQVIMFGFEKSRRYPNEKPVPFTILINPVIKILSNEMNDGWEGCLSVPGLRGLVSRFNKIEYSGFDPEGKQINRIVEGFHARILQHECDHLDGILFPQRLKDLRFFGFEDELHL